MRASSGCTVVALAGGILAAPAPVRSQDLDGTELIRPVPLEPAAYTPDGRDPFVPLTGGAEGEEDQPPRLDQLVLTGIFEGSPGNSLVVLEDPARRGHFLRIGETLGNARLLAILSGAAVFQVDDYGIVRRDTLRLEPARAEPAGSVPTAEPRTAPEPGPDEETAGEGP